ncbi:MAG TPA: hypothetical protein VIH90_01255 [Candidatus Saccharimonadales bacterium]
MNPTENSPSTNLNLPPPVIESGMVGATEISESPELATVASETIGQPKIPTVDIPLVQATDLPVDINIPQDDTSVAQTTTNIVAPPTADDNDLIEKEWVIKAKKIVDSNRSDPYNQTKEINLFRADYMKKRYNKVIKISE